MTNNTPDIDALRNSFSRVYHGPNRLQREYDLQHEAKRIGMLIEDYRQLYELRDEEEIEPYPQQKWWKKPGEWNAWFRGLPRPKKLTLPGKGGLWLLKQGFFITVAVGTIRYIAEAPKRQKLAHYQVWQMINSATGQKTSGGRIEALQDLVKDGVDLQGLDASGVNLRGIDLQNAKLGNANLYDVDLSHAKLNDARLVNINLTNANLYKANFNNTYFNRADLHNSSLSDTNLRYANFDNANLSNTNLNDANLKYAILRGANLKNAGLYDTSLIDADLACFDNYCTNFKGVKGLTPEQIKKASYWQSACYDPDFRIKLGLPPKNPYKCAGEEPTK